MKLKKIVKNRRLLDFYLGLTYDWREKRGNFWTLLAWMFVFSLILFVLSQGINLHVPGTNLQTHGSGSVSLLPDDHPAIKQAVFSKTPLPFRGPVWADPVTAGPVGEIASSISTLCPKMTDIQPLPSSRVRDVRDEFWSIGSFPTKRIETELAGFETSEPIFFVPYLSFCSDNLKDLSEQPSSQGGISREDRTSLSCRFMVRISLWGIPEEIVLLESSGDHEADQMAESYVRSLRGLPSAQPRSGMVTVEWNEKGGML